MTLSKNHFRSFLVDDASVVIASGATTSIEIDLSGTTLCGLYIPAAFTGTSISFETAAASAGMFHPVKNTAGNAISLTVAPGQFISLNPNDFLGIRFLKIVSGSAEAAVRLITLAARPL